MGSGDRPTGLLLRSAIRGRERWEVEAIKRAPVIAKELETALLQYEGVLAVSANPVSGRVLIHYTPDTFGLHVKSLLEDCLRGLESRIQSRPAHSSNQSPLSRILRQSLPERGHIVAPFVLSTLEHGLNMLQSLSFIGILGTARGVNSGWLYKLGFKRMSSRLIFMTGLSILLTGAHLLLQHYRKRAWRKLAQETRQRLNDELITRIQMQDMAFFDHHGTGRLIKLATEDTARIEEFVERAGDDVIQKSLVILVSGSVLITTSPGLALVVSLPLPFILISSYYFGRVVRERYAKAGELSGHFTQALENSLVGIADIKSFTAEEQEIRRLHEYGVRHAKADFDAASQAFLQSEFVSGLFSTGFHLASGYGGLRVAQDKISLNDYLALVYWFPQLLNALIRIEHVTGLYQRAGYSAGELVKVLDSEPGIRSGGVRMPAGTGRGEVAFENVSFGYAPGHQVLQDVSFSVRPGETIAIVGPTGSGKSTLLRLLTRLYEPDAGRILFDGIDIRDLNLTDLRASVSLVSQDVHLFEGTIRENVLYGVPDASEERIIEAMRDAGAADLLKYLPGGLDAQVGQRGHMLSGGERQRVAIARSLLKLAGGASILALDEATSHLDNETEAAIKRSLRTASSGKSVIMVAHRLSTIRSADMILVLEKGRLVEQGRHADLLARAGLYASLWHLQNDDPLGARLEVRLSDTGRD